MRLKSLTLTDFKSLESARLCEFEPGLNVVVGDNEAGKSTLLAALRAAFFQKHGARSAEVKALAPYNRTARPSVAVEFEIAETAYSLSKAFLQKPEASLVYAGTRLAGDAVEDRLAELFSFSHPGAGEPKREKHLGAFGLLWVEQGRSTEGLDVGAGRDAVTASLEGEVGQILGGERGRAMIAGAKALQDRFFTESGQKHRTGSPVRSAEDRLAGLATDLETLSARRRSFDQKLDRLASRRASLKTLDDPKELEAAEQALVEAEAARLRAANLEREVVEARRELEFAQNKRESAAERLGERDALKASGENAHVRAQNAAEVLDERRAADAAATTAEENARAERDAARASLDAARNAGERLRAAGERVRFDTGIVRLEGQVGEAEALTERLVGLRAADKGPAIDLATIAALEEAERKALDAAARMSIAVPSLLFAPDGSAVVRGEDGAPVEIGAPVSVGARTVFELDGFGRITVDPGTDAEALHKARRRADEAYAELLRRSGVASLAQARQRMEEGRTRRTEIGSLVKQLALLCPDGLDAARRLVEEMRRERDALPVAEEEDVPADASAVHRRLAEARERAADAEAVLDRMAGTRTERLAATAAAEAELRHARAEAERLHRQAIEAEAQRTRAALAQDLAAAEMERAAKAVVFERHERDLASIDPEQVRRTLEARRRAATVTREEIRKLKDEILTLDGELRAEGATGLGEKISECEEEIASIERRLARLRLEAEASRLLHATLLSAQREAREHWLGPISQEVAPYLKLIHPGTEIELDDTSLEILALRRAGVQEEFRRLSMGAREQIAVVTRIALAQVLRKGGHPAVVILDDALVNTDAKRLERMHLVLQKAAEDLQIIVLTCRERDFLGLGAPLFRL